MKDEYVIISKTDIQKRIENLEAADGFIKDYYNKAQLNCLKQILFQSTPLIPEIEKAWDASVDFNRPAGLDNNINKQDYIANLKLDI